MATACGRNGCGHRFSDHKNIQPPPWNWRGCSVQGCKCRSYKRGTYSVKRADGSAVRVTVPPRACQACGGEGCERCKNSDGYEPGEV
jgi:hypothetical protein